MKKKLLIAGLATVVCQVAHAAEEAGPPPGVLAQINLGKAGLLWSLYSDDQYGTVQTRIGEARSSYAAVNAGGPTSGYEDSSNTLIMPLKAAWALPDGKSYLRLRLKTTFADATSNQVENDGNTGLILATYQRFMSVSSMFSIGAFVENSDYEIVGTGDTTRDAYGLRLDAIHQLNDHWGMIGRARYSMGESDLKVPIAPGLTLRRNQSDDRFYTQGEIIGQYRKADMGWIPDGWALHPIIGGQYQRNFIEEVTDNLGNTVSGVDGDTEEYGTAWLKAQFQKEVPPGQWAPNFTLGIEQEWVNSLDEHVDEPTFGFAEIGLSKMWKNGNRLDLVYGRHQGLNDTRWSQSLVASLTVQF